MKQYLNQKVDRDNIDGVSVMDELPFWSAPFGIQLLNTIQLKPKLRVLDVGCCAGFPLIEIAQRLGSASLVYGIDPWNRALDRVCLKCRVYDIHNVEVIRGNAEHMPFHDACFNLIVSNNGITNTRDLNQTLQECGRISCPNAQLVMTYNSENTMIEFYSVLRKVLVEQQLSESVLKMRSHIHEKRKPLKYMTTIIKQAGFLIKTIHSHSFRLKFIDGTAMLNHYLIRFWFIENWKKLIPDDMVETIFEEVESRLNMLAEDRGELVLSVPFITLDCRRQ
ncbi:class I SAM-dependent methyltransferase [bacterium]|nr:class I SAM-dependent methyltransferase [bacterium]